MDKFLSLPSEKQRVIIDAAISSFGKNGYKKTSINDIASAAGISKAMMFYYFGNKKELYMYVANFCGSMVLEEINKHLDSSIIDLFDKLAAIAEIKTGAIKRHPHIMSFLASMLHETDPAVSGDIRTLIIEGGNRSSFFTLADSDLLRFKDGVDVRLLFKFLLWASEGVANEMTSETILKTIDEYTEDFIKCLKLLKRFLYKEEYL